MPPLDLYDVGFVGVAGASGDADATYGMFMGGHAVLNGSVGYTAEINRTTIGTSGDGEDFGDLTTARGWTMTAADATRGVCAGGGVYSDVIDYVTVAGAVDGTATPWGADLSATREQASSCCDETHGLFAGGYGSIGASGTNVQLETVDHITIQTTGVCGDWGDMQTVRYVTAGCSTTGVLNNSHGMIFAGYITSFVATESIQYLPIGTTGVADDFGDCTVKRSDAAACANTSRAVVGAGVVPSPVGRVKTTDYFAVGTTGTAGNFGDLNLALEAMKGCCNETYGLFAGGSTREPDGSQVKQDAIEYLTIATEGGGHPFGDLTRATIGSGGLAA